MNAPWQQILQFWFDDIKPGQWWQKDAVLDQRITDRFADLHATATRCELFAWRQEPLGRLAEILVLDQFSRNMYRGSPLAFAHDTLALALAQEALAAQADKALTPVQRSFLYMPFMHSESRVMHQIAVVLFAANGIKENYDYELLHKAIIDRFGRYPHRNAMLGRVSTAEETEFLKQPGSAF